LTLRVAKSQSFFSGETKSGLGKMVLVCSTSDTVIISDLEELPAAAHAVPADDSSAFFKDGYAEKNEVIVFFMVPIWLPWILCLQKEKRRRSNSYNNKLWSNLADSLPYCLLCVKG